MYDDVARDRQLGLSLVKEVEIIGEAAGKLSTETRLAYPQIDWRTIIATRNRLIHMYFDIDFGLIWKTVLQDLPALIAQLEDLLGPAERQPDRE